VNHYYVYIAASRNRALYIGVTGNIERRSWLHKTGALEGHTKKYRIVKLVYVEETGDVDVALAREKQLKRWRREKKEALIEAQNPLWADLLGPEIPRLRRLERQREKEAEQRRLRSE
jgi:putative endonuclease